MIEVAEGTPRGQPRPLVDEFKGWPIGFTADSSFYYGTDTAASNVYLARLDSTGLNFEGEPKLVSSQFVGSTTMGNFSPDGSLLAYRAGSGVKDGPLVVYSVATASERIISTSHLIRPHTRMWGPRFSPDGQSLLMCGEAHEGGYKLYIINTETGVPTQILSIGDRRFRYAVWSPDGKSIYTCSEKILSRFDLPSGLETQLYLVTDKWKEMSGLDVSPDGRWLVFYLEKNSLLDKNSLVVLNSAGGEPREVVHLDKDEVSDSHAHVFVRWMPDGEHLLFSKRKKELWKVHIESGDQQQIGPVIDALIGATMHPDGRKITFTSFQRGSALWVMENFLPD